MIVRSVNECKAVDCPKGAFSSSRLLLESDGMGYTLTSTSIPKGGPWLWHYKNHLEACFCISGFGVLRDMSSCDEHLIQPGVMYALNNHDEHTFEALEDTVLICVFNPPLKGGEVHDKEGVYHV